MNIGVFPKNLTHFLAKMNFAKGAMRCQTMDSYRSWKTWEVIGSHEMEAKIMESHGKAIYFLRIKSQKN